MLDLSTIMTSLAGLISASYSLFTGNVAALFNFFSPLLALRSVNWTAVLGELQALTPEQRKALDAQFDASLAIPNPALLAKMVGVESTLEAAITVAQQGYGVYVGAAAVLAQLKALFVTQMAAEQKMAAGVPSWLASVLPPWIPAWLVNTVLGLVPAALKALEGAFPLEAPLIQDLLVFWNGGVASPKLKTMYESYHRKV